MSGKQRRKILMELFNQSYIKKAIVCYLISFAVISLLMMITDRNINNYWDALWYCFVSCTTIGFGDFAATSLVSRLLTVIMYIITVFLLAAVTAVFVQVFTEILKARKEDAVSGFMYDLEHLDQLSEEELKNLSKKIRDMGK